MTTVSQVGEVSAAESTTLPSDFVETRGVPSSIGAGLCSYLWCGSCKGARAKGATHGLKFPRDGAEMSKMGATWVSTALRKAGKISADNSCTKCEVGPLGETGILGEMCLVKWEFAKPVSFPAEVVAKFSIPPGKPNMLCHAMGMFSSEYHFCA